MQLRIGRAGVGAARRRAWAMKSSVCSGLRIWKANLPRPKPPWTARISFRRRSGVIAPNAVAGQKLNSRPAAPSAMSSVGVEPPRIPYWRIGRRQGRGESRKGLLRALAGFVPIKSTSKSRLASSGRKRASASGVGS